MIPVIALLQAEFSVKVTLKGASTVGVVAAVKVGGVNNEAVEAAAKLVQAVDVEAPYAILIPSTEKFGCAEVLLWAKKKLPLDERAFPLVPLVIDTSALLVFGSDERVGLTHK